MFLLEIDLASLRFPRSSHKYLMMIRQVGWSTQDPSGWLMAPWTFSVKFPYDTQFIFGLLMFATGEDGNLELLTRVLVPRHP
jgi:hypothetical protein